MSVLKQRIKISLVDMIQEDVFIDESALLKLLEEDISEEIKEAINSYIELSENLQNITLALEKQLKKRNSTDYKIALNWYELLASIDDTAKQLIEIENLQNEEHVFTAPKQGSITTVYGKVGDIYSSANPLYAMTLQEYPVITIPKDQVSLDKTFMKNTYKLRYKEKIYSCEKLGTDNDNLILLPSEELFEDNRVELLIGTTFQINSNTPEQTYLNAIPVTCIIKKGNKNFIYKVVVKQGLWEEEYRVEEIEVDIIAYNSRYAAISTSVGGYILNSWDRYIVDGQRVYEYAD